MNKKRVTAVILSAMMCMQIFTGCGAKNNAAAVEGGAGQTATESTDSRGKCAGNGRSGWNRRKHDWK